MENSEKLKKSLMKTGKPFKMPPYLEIKVINHIVGKQDLGFGLTI
jgi:hypothetical protein